MKKMKVVLLVGFTIGLFGINSVSAQTENKQQFVIIEVFETLMADKSKMIVIDNNGNIITSELEKVVLKNYIETSGKNTVAIHKEIKKWTEIGYVIQSYDKKPGNYLLTTIVLVKD